MRRNQVIVLAVVLVLTAAVLAAKALGREGEQTPVTAARAPSLLEGATSSASAAMQGDRQPATSLQTIPSPTAEKTTAPVIDFPTDGRPVLLFFNGKSGCECEMREYEAADCALASVPADLRARFVVAWVDIHQDKETVHQYRVMFPPAAILLDSEEKEVYRREYGVYGPTLIEEMTNLVGDELKSVG
jgi:hypothetical protein